MKTYKEYYQFGLNEHLDWKSRQDEEWWKNKDDYRYLDTKGDYIETVRLLTVDEKNDSSLFTNATNVKNSEWGILFSMLGQALVDWCRENVSYKKLWNFGFRIDRGVDDGKSFYVPSFTVRKLVSSEDKWIKPEEETDEKKLKKFEKCADFLFGLVTEFIERNGNNIPNDWNYFSFGLDCLYESCKWGEWVCSSDGYMNLANYNEETNEYDEFVACM